MISLIHASVTMRSDDLNPLNRIVSRSACSNDNSNNHSNDNNYNNNNKNNNYCIIILFLLKWNKNRHSWIKYFINCSAEHKTFQSVMHLSHTTKQWKIQEKTGNKLQQPGASIFYTNVKLYQWHWERPADTFWWKVLWFLRKNIF